MITEILNIEDINPAPYNPRRTLESGEREYESLKKSLKKFGVVEPLVVNKRTGVLVGGHQRYNVLKELGETRVEAVVIDVDEKTEKRLNLALNRVDGRWDYEKLNSLLQELTDEELAFTGFVNSVESEKTLDEQKPKEPKATTEDKGFEVYVSFDSKDSANEWLEDHGFEERITAGTSLIIRMGEVE